MLTISRKSQNDDLRGTLGNEVILAAAGNDRLGDGKGALQLDTRENCYYVAGNDSLEGRSGNVEFILNVTGVPNHDRGYGGRAATPSSTAWAVT